MATQSTPSSGVKPDNPEVVQSTLGGQHEAPETKENSTASVFVNSEPIREEQVQNAIKFLSHPKVRGSPVMYRRSFLEKKGLTKEEIDEAFRRVPDPPPAVLSGQTAGTNDDSQLKPLPNTQTLAQTQTLQPAPAPPAGVISKVGTLTKSGFHWSHALLAVGFLAVSGAGTAIVFKKAVVPRLKSWIRKVVSDEEEDSANASNLKPSLGEETAAAAKAAAAAATDVARASQDMLISKTEEKKCFEDLIKLLNIQVQEMKSMSNAIRNLEAQSSTPQRSPYVGQEDYRTSVSSSREIKDFTPHSNYPVSNPRFATTAKERSDDGLNSNGYSDILNGGGDSSVPWWQQKNVRITEYENGHEPKAASSNERPIQQQQQQQRSWVPPQPPPVAIPEAAAAIRQPKKSVFQKEQLNDDDDQLLAQSADATDELQRITKISESGGFDKANGASSSSTTNSGEIQEEVEAVEQN